MNIFYINKSIFILFFFIFITSCSTKTISDKFKIKKYEVLVADVFDDNDIISNSNTKEINYENKQILKNFKNTNFHFSNIALVNDLIFTLNDQNQILKYDSKTGELISNTEIKILKNEKNDLVSLDYIENSLILAFKSGSIFRVKINGDVIWHFKSNKILNTPLVLFDEQIIVLFGDEIKGLLIDDGSEKWSEMYKGTPVFQARGGQIDNFLHLLFFILPNNKVGSIDFNTGSINRSNFDEIPIISSINNSKDKIYIYKNYLIYLDEGRYIYTFDIFKDDFILFKKNINLASSKIFLNNSIILKNGNYLQAINLINGKTFWLINNDKISKNASLISARYNNSDIEIFLSNGDLLLINNKELNDIKNLNIGKIIKISFKEENIIVHTNNGKIVIF